MVLPTETWVSQEYMITTGGPQIHRCIYHTMLGIFAVLCTRNLKEARVHPYKYKLSVRRDIWVATNLTLAMFECEFFITEHA